MLRTGYLLVIGAFVFAVSSRDCQADVVWLKNGGELRGLVGLVTEDEVVIRTEAGTKATIPAGEVHFVAHRSVAEDEFERRLAELPNKAAAHWQLAQWCKQNRLRDQFKRQLRQVLILSLIHI